MKSFTRRSLLIFFFLLNFFLPVKNALSTCPLSPPVISVNSVSACRVKITWAGDANTSFYKVKYKVKSQSSWTGIFNVGLTNSYSFTNLLGNTNYVFEVVPYCANNQAGPLAKKTVLTATCSRPEEVAASNIDNTFVTISWNICGTGNGAFVRIKPKGTNQWKTYSAEQQTFLNLTNLIPHTKYQYQVNTCDTNNLLLWSATKNFTTLLKQAWQPNILLIYLDDCRYDAFAPNGGPSFFHSPAINSIAEEGANFRWCFPALSLCCPSRASIVTGLYPHHHGVFSNEILDSFSHITLAQIMHDAGYYVGFVGKYDFQKFPVPGYDYYCQSSNDAYWNTKYQYNSKPFITIPGHKTEVLTYKTLEFLNQVPPGKKFMLSLAHKAPHVPYDPRLEDEGLFDGDTMPFPANYDAYSKNIPSHYYECNQQYPDPADVTTNYRDIFELINGAEWSVDIIFNYLQSKNLLDSTLIIFTSDNGVLVGEHELGGKEISLEPSIQLPMFIRYPKWFSPGTVINNEMAMNIDVAPTILDAAGIPDTFNMDGVSMYALANGTVHRKELFYEFFYRYNCNPTFQAVRSFDHKYIHNECSASSEEFYDLLNDPLETQNLIYDPDYATAVAIYKSKLDSLKNVYGYVNISDTILNCSLSNIDSSVVIFKMDSRIPMTVKLFPNPVRDRITLIFEAGTETDAHLSVINIFSQPVYEKDLYLPKDRYQFTMDVEDYAPGTYIVNLLSGGRNESLLFVKQ